jgi:hypothetical protein
VIEIEEPPTDIRACATCQRPLVWLFSARTRVWIAFATVPDKVDELRVHRCRLEPRSSDYWRYLELQDPETIHAGAALVRAELAKSQERIEGEAHGGTETS